MGNRVLIADDHAVWRQGLRAVLEPTFEVVSEASGGHEAVEKAMACRPDVVVMDVHLPGMDGITAAQRITERFPETGVIMISASAEDREIYEAIQAGALGYIVKSESPETMCRAVRDVADGKAHLPPLIAKRVLQAMAASLPVQNERLSAAYAQLSEREVAVLRLIVEGRTQGQIARELCVSARTVGNHMTRIYAKLRLQNRSQLVAYAIRKGIVRL